VAGAVLIPLVALMSATALRFNTPYVRERAVAALSSYFGGEVEIASLGVTPFPTFRAGGEGLVIRRRGRSDAGPVITIERFEVDAGLLGLMRRPVRVSAVRLQGLRIYIPAGDRGEDERDEPRGEGTPVVIDRIVSEDARLEIASSKPGAPPREFELHRLVLRSVALDRPVAYESELTNWKPPGLIRTEGEFGPWDRDAPRRTPVAGSYTFTDADLSVFGGLGGTLSSTGEFGGLLERIEVRGETETSDFTLSVGGNPLPLRTRFEAVVDGTDGDTHLRPVRAQLAGSHLVAAGSIVGAPGREKGREIVLDVTVERGRLEDFLRLAVKGPTPPMSGGITLKTSLHLPPGDNEVLDRLNLQGRFGLSDAEFADVRVQEKVDELSQKGRGRPGGEDEGREVLSNLKGNFVLRDGVMTLTHLTFDVPGASVALDGTYAVREETLDFRGVLRLDAKLSQTTTGVKSILLRVVDPLFRRRGSSVLPVKVTGTIADPSFGLDSRRLLSPRGGERPPG
jgi:hypothetical protein